MTWEELLSSKDYIYIGKCCGNWSKYVTKSNWDGQKVIDSSKILRIRANKLKVQEGGRFLIKQLRELEDYLKSIA